MKLAGPLIFIISASSACGSTSSHNAYDGGAENYNCTNPNGSTQLMQLSEPSPGCIKLSSLPADEAKAIIDKANGINPTPVEPTSIHLAPR